MLDILSSLLNKWSVSYDDVIILKCGWDLVKTLNCFLYFMILQIFWKFVNFLAGQSFNISKLSGFLISFKSWYNWAFLYFINLWSCVQLEFFKLVKCQNLLIFYSTFLPGKVTETRKWKFVDKKLKQLILTWVGLLNLHNLPKMWFLFLVQKMWRFKIMQMVAVGRWR